jgi:hypothetical protein
MAQKALDKSIVDSIVADWRTGAYSQQDLAKRHSVSKGVVNKLCKGIAQDCSAIVTAGIQYNQGLAGHDDQIVTAIVTIVDDEKKRLLNFRNRRDKIAELAYDRLEKEIPYCEIQHVKPLIEAADKVSVMVGDNPRFNPNASIVNNNTNAQQNNSAESIRDEIIKRVLSGDE